MHVLGGRAGWLWEPFSRIIRDSYAAGHEVILLVPEQYTLQAERDCLALLSAKGFFRLQVLSPSRLKDYVFEREGRDARVVIDERGRLLTMARSVWMRRDDLVFYAGAKDSPGFTKRLTEAVGEFKGAGMTPQELSDFIGSKADPDPRLRDLALLYTQYEELLAGRWQDRDDEDRELIRRLTASPLMDGVHLFLYGFDLITPPLARIVTASLSRAGEVHIALVMDKESAPDGGMFAPVRDSVTLLIQEAGLLGHKVEIEWLPPGDGKPKALSYLERHLMALGSIPFTLSPEGLRLFAGKSAHDEVRWAAQILRQEMLSGTRPGDMAVILAQEEHAGLVPGVFADYHIPHYLARKQPILAHALVRCLLDALSAIRAAAWQKDDVLGYAKSPFSPLTPAEGWELENWALKWGIHGKRWTVPFDRGEPEDNAYFDALRHKAVAPVLRMRDALVRARTATQSIRAVTDFLEELRAREKIEALELELLSRGMPEESIRTRQVWDRLTGLFEQMNELIGGERIPLGRFPEWLEEGLAMTELSALPPTENAVQVGALGQLMVRTPQVVVVLGLHQGALSLNDQALINDQDKVKLEGALGVRLSLNISDRERIRRMDFWKAAAAPSRLLGLSYALSDDRGEAAAPLPELGRVRALFPTLVEEGGAMGALRDPMPLAPAAALDEIALRLSEGQMTGAWWQALDFLREHPEYEKTARAAVAAAAGDDPDKRLLEVNPRELFDARAVSVSRLEAYAACPFRHFVEHGLRPHEREEWAVTRRDLGDFAHAAMDGFARKIRQNPQWPDISREETERMMDEVLQGLTVDWPLTAWADTPRAAKEAGHHLDAVRRTAWAVTEGSQGSAFRPLDSEVKFGPGERIPPLELPLGDGTSLSLRGTIDRVDAAQTPDATYMRVVDYKTGNAELSPSDFAQGLQLQLLLYLRAALGLVEGSRPAGAFYQKVDDPVVRAQTEIEAQKEARRQLRMNGVVLANADVIRLMNASGASASLPGYVRKDGELRESDRALTPRQLDELLELTRRKAVELARGIFSGSVARSPVVHPDGMAVCSHCPHWCVCRHDRAGREKMRRRGQKTSFRELTGGAAAPGDEDENDGL